MYLVSLLRYMSFIYVLLSNNSIHQNKCSQSSPNKHSQSMWMWPVCVCEQNTLHSPECSLCEVAIENTCWLTQAQTETVSKALVITSWLEKLLWSCSTPILIVFLLYFYYPTVYLWLWQMATKHWAQFCLRSSPVQRQSFLTTVASCLLMGDSRVSVNELKSVV